MLFLMISSFSTSFRYGYEVLKECWEIIPSEHRSLLISEIETLCQHAGIIPGVSWTLSLLICSII